MIAIALIEKSISSTITYHSIYVAKISATPMKPLEQLFDIFQLVLEIKIPRHFKNLKPVFKYSPAQQNNIATTLSRAVSQQVYT